MSIQDFFDSMSAHWQRERATTQITLGRLIDVLEAMPADEYVANLGNPHSYRGYYSDMAFELSAGVRPAAELLDECKAAMGHVFEGYKGGEYLMGALTPIWVSDYGTTGARLMALHTGGEIETADDTG
jgi:hypothetical protein